MDIMEIRTSTVKRRMPWILSGTAVLLAAAAFFYPACRWQRVFASQEKSAQEKEAPRAAGPDQSTSLIDQTDLNVTVYNSNIALVRDVRNLTLPSGTFRLKFMDIAATVHPATVHFRSLTDPEKLGVIEQNYEYDLLEPPNSCTSTSARKSRWCARIKRTIRRNAKRSKRPCFPITTAPSGRSATTS